MELRLVSSVIIPGGAGLVGGEAALHHPLFPASARIQSGWTFSQRHQRRSDQLSPHRNLRALMQSSPEVFCASLKANRITDTASRLYAPRSLSSGRISGMRTCALIISCIMAPDS